MHNIFVINLSFILYLRRQRNFQHLQWSASDVWFSLNLISLLFCSHLKSKTIASYCNAGVLQHWCREFELFVVLQGPGLTDEQVLQLCRGVVTAQISQYASSIRAKCSQGCPINNRTLIGPPGAQGPPGPPGKAASPSSVFLLFIIYLSF